MTKQLQKISAPMAALTMTGALVLFSLAVLLSVPREIFSWIVLGTLVINLLGIATLANVPAKTGATRLVGTFLGFYLALSAIRGTFIAGIQTELQLLAAVAFSFCLAVLGGRLIEQKARATQILLPLFELLIVGFVVYGFATQRSEFAIHQYNHAFGIGAIFGGLAFIPQVRLRIARLFSLNASAATTLTTLVIGALVAGFCLESFSSYAIRINGLTANPVTPLLVFGQLVTFVMLAFLGVGWLTRRTFSETLSRLGITLPRWRDFWPIVGFTLLIFIMNMVVGALGAALHLKDVDETTKMLLGNFHQFGGMLFLAAAAGIGEEILFRGALQPRFGIILTSLAFASLHFQYQWFSLLIVVGIGIILGLERKKYGTTAAILSHLLYDLLGLAIIFSAR